MDSYKLAQFCSSFIEINRLRFVPSQNIPHQIYMNILNGINIQQDSKQLIYNFKNSQSLI